MGSREGGGWGSTLRVTPRSLLYPRVCQLGRSGIHALRQEQRGCSVGEGRAGDGEGDACLPAWLAFILTSMCINGQIVPAC